MRIPALAGNIWPLAFILAVGAAVPAHADEPAPPDLSAYRLAPDATLSARPEAPQPAASPAPEPRPEFTVSSRLAGMPFAKLIEGAAREASLDPALVHAVIAVESGYNPAARSPAANLRAGTLYLRDLMVLFDRRLELVLAAYNAGEGAVLRYGERIPPFPESRQYVPAVLARYLDWREPPPRIEPIVPAAPARTRVTYMPGTLLEISSPQMTGYR